MIRFRFLSPTIQLNPTIICVGNRDLQENSIRNQHLSCRIKTFPIRVVSNDGIKLLRSPFLTWVMWMRPETFPAAFSFQHTHEPWFRLDGEVDECAERGHLPAISSPWTHAWNMASSGGKCQWMIEVPSANCQPGGPMF